MASEAILGAVLGFLATLAVHIGLWRFRRPRGQIRALALLFLAIAPAAGLSMNAWRGFPPQALALQGLLHLLFSCAYVLTFPAIQARCPTLEIVRIVARSGGAGIDFAGIARRFSPEQLIGGRYQDLWDDRLLLTGPDGRPALTPFAKSALAAMKTLRRILGLPPGTG